jgi:voltage-gated potassium channel
MKNIGLILSYLAGSSRRRDIRLMLRMLGIFLLLVVIYSTVFHVLMDAEDQEHSWPTAFYWTLVTMTTVGFGDITFTEDAGRIFSVVVLLCGIAFLLVILPFTFIQFVFVPWMDRRAAARAPRELPADTQDHLILTGLGPIEDALIRRADRAGVPYVLLVSELAEALRLHDDGYRVMVGLLDDPAAYRAARVERAALVAATRADTTNTNIAFTVQEISERVRIVASASSHASVDILELAGADVVLELGEILGTMMARRVLGTDARSQVIGSMSGVHIAEAGVNGSPLVGQTIEDAQIRARVGVNVVGVWNRGRFSLATPDTVIAPMTVLILSGTPEQLEAYDSVFAATQDTERPVVVVGGGRVGRQVGRSLEQVGIPHRIVEQRADRIRDPARYVEGDAASLEVLEQAGIREASAVVITTHDDDVNVYLSIYCRRLRDDIQIIARSNLERNVSTLYRAGADAVLSYAAIGAAAIWNSFRANDTLLLAEGLDVFRVPVPERLAGRPLAEAGIREETGCSVVAVCASGTDGAAPEPGTTLPPGGEMVLIGDAEAEARFLGRYGGE